ncbi:MAG TPA: hypothetical protein VM536_13070 [Chloroflexia bacterium]|nr:hypothetical protein [Chloroflexia bacterium]
MNPQARSAAQPQAAVSRAEHSSRSEPRGREYRVYAAEHSAYMDPAAARLDGQYPTCCAAMARCQALVDRSLDELYVAGMPAATLLGLYLLYGEDPWITVPGATEPCVFSALDYAAARCESRAASGQ